MESPFMTICGFPVEVREDAPQDRIILHSKVMESIQTQMILTSVRFPDEDKSA